MGRKPLGNVALTRRISPAYVAMLEQLEAAGVDLEAIIASGHYLIGTAATHTGYDPFDHTGGHVRVYEQINALMAKELFGETWASSFARKPENFQPFDEVYMERINRNLEKHRAYHTYLKARRADREDSGAGATALDAQNAAGAKEG